MQIQLIDNDPALHEELAIRLQSSGIEVCQSDVPDANSLHQWHTTADLFVVGQHAIADSLAQVSRHLWPKPVVALLPLSDTAHIMQVARDGAADAHPRSASLESIAQWLTKLCEELVSREDNKPVASHFRHDGCDLMAALQRHVERAASTDSSVLILGETGTGKELVAREIHNLGSRSARPLITVNCAAIPDTLIESELFGYEKGAFTGATSNRIGLIEAADGGTLFLDEIGELPLPAQARLLRFFQEGEIRQIGSVSNKKVDVRMICATHRDLSTLSARNAFRQDLFYRIDVLRIAIPPLRDRGHNILAMAEWFIQQHAHRLGLPVRPLSESSAEQIAAHDWPGNVRELQNVIERALVMSEGNSLTLSLSRGPAGPVQDSAPLTERHQGGSTSESSEASEELSLEDYFQRFVLEHQDSMNETELAQKLGISRKCLWERRQRFGIPRNRRRTA
ncbi:MAG: response regulator [Halieaceae bacterium]|nr:response regulator [Halieaceae bacterium]